MKIYLLLLLLLPAWVAFCQPVNDNPCGAIALTVGSSCSYTTASLPSSATLTSAAIAPAPSCEFIWNTTFNEDIWFSFTVPASGAVLVNTDDGTITDAGMALYTGACGGPLTQIACDDDSSPNAFFMPMIQATGLTPGTTVYIRTWTLLSNGNFTICVMQTGPCGTPQTNDYCSHPAILTQGPGDFSASTDVTFSADLPGNLGSVFCGSVENNSWYQFVASSTTHTFPITTVTGCIANNGIQAQVYSVTTNAQGCCTGFTSVSNCFNPMTATTGVVTATGLTVGQTYILMVDGFAGDGCEFTISGWTATGILPVILSEFTGLDTEDGNLISWKTQSEFHSDYFELLHSRDGVSFNTIAVLDGQGNTNKETKYAFLHENAPYGNNYYQLKQVDTDGKSDYSKILDLDRSKDNNGVIGLYPNPAKEKLVLEYYSNRPGELLVRIHNQAGSVCFSEAKNLNPGLSQLYLDISGLAPGIYYLQSATGENLHTQKLVIE